MFLSRCGANYYLFYQDELGMRHKVSTGSSRKADALGFLQDFKRQERDRRNKLQKVSLSQFSATYLQHSRSINTPKTVESNATALSEFQRIIGDLPLHKVGVRDIEMFLARKRGEASEWTARKYYLALAAAFETAKRWGHLPSNPFRLVEKPKVPEILPVFLSRDEFSILMTAIPSQEMRDLVLCAASTGMRLGELLALSWSDVDLSQRVVTVQNSERFTTKNRRTRVIPVNEGLWQMLVDRQNRITNEVALVFHENGVPHNAKKVSKAFKRCILAAGLDKRLHFHSVRHGFASWLAQDGVSLYAIQKLLGHSSASTTQVYSHLQPSELREEVERISISKN